MSTNRDKDAEITIEDVRGAVVLAMEGFWHPDAGADFDRWLAEHDRAIAAAAWDEGKAVGIEAAVTRQHDGWVEGLKYNAYHPNPYALVTDPAKEN